MKKTLAAACLLLLASAAGASDDPTRIYSEPAVPSREALDRLNLDMAWAVYVPMESKRDGFASVQVDGNQLIIQTRSGMITVLDVEKDGRALWRSHPGRPYQTALRPTFNSRAVFLNDSGDVYAIDRATGSLQWKSYLRVALSAPLSADERKVYLQNVEARLIALNLPPASTPGGPAPSPGEPKPGDATPPAPAAAPAPAAEEAEPTIAFDFDTNQRVENKAVLSKDVIFLAIPNGSYLAVPKVGDAGLENHELYHYSGDSRFVAPLGHSDDAVYLATEDTHLYAIAIDSGRVLWRYFPGRQVTRRPIAVDVTEGAVSDKDLYVTAAGKGMARLNRETGEPVWSIRKQDFNPDAERFYAANPKFVYADDGAGRMLVLDRKNGSELSRYDVHDYVFPIFNDHTDRIFLAANNGLIVCLHDKDYAQPLAYRKVEKTLDERIKDVTAKLAAPITDPGGEMMQFRAYRTKIEKQYGIPMFVSRAAFTELNKPLPDDAMITTPKADNEPLLSVINKVAQQAGAEVNQNEVNLLVSPAKMK